MDLHESMIDTRFPPESHQISVPLYPTKEISASGGGLKVYDQNAVQEFSNAFGCRPEDTVLGNSASSLLREYLRLKVRNDKLTISLPSFSCQSLVDAIIDSGNLPQFYDLDENANVSGSAHDFVLRKGTDMFLWPSYFGTRQRDRTVIESLRERNISIIFDDAQSSPFSEESSNTRKDLHEDEVILYSFGWSKAFACSGGGMLCGISERNHAVYKLREHITELSERNTSSTSDDEKKELDTFPHRAAVGNPSYTQQPIYSKLDDLLEMRVHEGAELEPMSRYCVQQILGRLATLDHITIGHKKAYEGIRNDILGKLGLSSLSLLDSIQGSPTILALKVDNSLRYGMMEHFSQRGIQTTWYYYPLNLVDRYRCYPSQSLKGSLSLAGAVLILPLQPYHTTEQVMLLEDAVRDL